ncbi:oxidoreductase [Vibrio sp.]|uniref:Oxidoreductase n=1 Tax=Vibrio viridaestus TaxID=2487322 RepID=A0A3N9TG18_9VIBR|nr:oxidoreductase [Vibrio viridaestus]MDC0611824.1 oxidoreductase [Vibrio sp.]RQW63207.1 oxidoreductase [Vibrio viridaestus]
MQNILSPKFCLSLVIAFCALFSFTINAKENSILTFEINNESYQYTLDDLTQMSDTEFKTETPWTAGKTDFSGVSLKKLAQQHNISSGTFKVIALNNYWSEIPYSDIDNYDPIIAIKKNGKFMPIRDKGPLWIVYPLSQKGEVNNELLHSRMVWQTSKIEWTAN